MTKLVNLTGHELKLTDGSTITHIASDGRARVLSDGKTIAMVSVDGLQAPLPFTLLSNRTLVDLPEPEDSVIYVVSGIVAAYTPRMDVVAPGRVYREQGGRVIGCQGFVKATQGTSNTS